MWDSRLPQFVLKQNTQRARYTSMSRKEHSRLVLSEDLPGFLFEAKYKEKEKIVVLGGCNNSCSLKFAVDIGQQRLRIRHQLRITGNAADQVFQKFFGQPDKIDVIFAFQFQYMLEQATEPDQLPLC